MIMDLDSMEIEGNHEHRTVTLPNDSPSPANPFSRSTRGRSFMKLQSARRDTLTANGTLSINKELDKFANEAKQFVVQVSKPNRFKILLQTLAFACIIVAIRYLVEEGTGWRGYLVLSELSLVFTGMFFTMGILFSQVNSDLKEAERMPSEVATALEQIEDLFRYMTKKAKDPDLRPVYLILLRFITYFKKSLGDPSMSPHCYDELCKLPIIASEWDARGAPSTYYVLAAVDRVRRVVTRAGVVSRTDVLPGAQALLQFFVLATSVMLFLTDYSTDVAQITIMTCVYTVTWYNVRLIDFIDDPFNKKMPMGMSSIFGEIPQVFVFPLDEYALRVISRLQKANPEADEAELEKLHLAVPAGDFCVANLAVEMYNLEPAKF